MFSLDSSGNFIIDKLVLESINWIGNYRLSLHAVFTQEFQKRSYGISRLDRSKRERTMFSWS